MNSDPLSADSDEILQSQSVHSQEVKGEIPKLKVEYVNRESFCALTAKRALEIYSPLKGSQRNNFTFTLYDIYDSDKGEVAVIHFKTKPNAYSPQKTRLLGQGFIHCLVDSAVPIKIVTENMRDSYTAMPRMFGNVPSVTQHKIEVEYGQTDQGLYTKSIAMWIDWTDPGVADGWVYYITWQRRRKPIENRLKEYCYFSFSDVVPIDKEHRYLITERMREGEYFATEIPAMFDRDKWDIAMPGIDKAKLLTDPNANGKTLYEQAQQNELDFPLLPENPTPKALEWDKYYHSYYLLVRDDFHKELYGKPYE